MEAAYLKTFGRFGPFSGPILAPMSPSSPLFGKQVEKPHTVVPTFSFATVGDGVG
jgi:hypothetical protein